MGKTGPSSIGGGPDSGHETLLSDGEEETSQISHSILDQSSYHQYPPHPIERASSEVIYSTISSSSHLGTRSRRSLAEPPSSNVMNNKLFSNGMEDMEHPPMIAPISGVPNIKGKAVIRPIAFRPTPLGSQGLNNKNIIGPHNYSQASPSNLNIFAPGHPLVKDGRRHYGSSQELHVHHPTNSSSASFNKFNSLDRRALSRRQNLKLALDPSSQVPGAPQPSSLIVLSNNNGSSSGSNSSGSSSDKVVPRCSVDLNKINCETNGRTYDRNLTASVSSNGSTSNNGSINNRLKICDNSSKLSAMNINGLPDPSIYSSQESIHNHRIPRPGTGTPQFQNLSGVVRTCSSSFHSNSMVESKSSQDSSSSFKSSSCVGGKGGNNLYSSDSSTIGENQTPSPSDSAVGDLEHMLKEKDTEINYLKETIEQNEQVIFKVYEEKEKMWEREFRKVKGLYDNRLRLSQQKSLKMEQALTNQTYQLQNEKRKLELDLDELKKYAEEKERENISFRQELDHLRKTLKESEWTSCAKSGEISILLEQQQQVAAASSKNVNSSSSKNELIDLKRELERRNSELQDLLMSKRSLQIEVLSLKAQLDRSSHDEDDVDGDPESIRGEIITQKETIISRDLEIEKLHSDLESVRHKSGLLKEETDRCKENFEMEKAHWLDEKEKVIRYQKQLQLNYVQMYKKNKQFEAEIESLKQKLASEPSSKRSSFLSHLSLGNRNSNSSSHPSSSGAAVKSPPGGAAVSNVGSSNNTNVAKSKFFKMTLTSESNC